MTSKTQIKKYNKVIFLEINSPQEKIQQIIKISLEAFQRKDPMLFLTKDASAAAYIDLLLWRFPKDSFLPHSLAAKQTNENIVIAASFESVENFTTIFNLTDKPFSLKNNSLLIYEFDDNTSLEKKRISKNNYKFYKENGFAIVSL
ncbi:MAG: hypothetical protein Tsb0015_14040 [Simkaniaceae bacterium]